jgi:integrase
MASLLERHGRGCPAYRSSGYTALDPENCTCRPSYYTVVSRDGRTIRENVGKVRRKAEQALKVLNGRLAEGTFEPQRMIRFDTWADRWLESLETKANTRRSYTSTMGYAKEVLGSKAVRRLTTEDIVRFNTFLRDIRIGTPPRPLSDSNRGKHLRVLGACLNSAIAHGYASSNPVKRMPKGEKPKPRKRESAYFTNAELPLILNQIRDGLYRTLFLTALKTGMRKGELVAMTWADVDLLDKVIRVRHGYTDGQLSTPKNHEQRDVDFTSDTQALLARWKNELGDPTDGALVFPGSHGYLDGSALTRRVLYKAMERAGVDRVGPTGEPRTWHSLRHTFAKIALENGRGIHWLQRHLGHSSLKVTADIYGHWERDERKKQVAALEGAWSV